MSTACIIGMWLQKCSSICFFLGTFIHCTFVQHCRYSLRIPLLALCSAPLYPMHDSSWSRTFPFIVRLARAQVCSPLNIPYAYKDNKSHGVPLIFLSHNRPQDSS
ncbi:hypothetical protein BDV97DRAFT_17807 [Delphinella strobiligena]|nr:hypothetical protein BDV97DRAFT_17807 [Delphinella strobiligena]